jgi:hypothetical protein
MAKSRIMKTAALPILIILILSSCSNQRLSTDEHDDIYYSSSDRFNDQPSEFNQVEEVSGEDYINKDDYHQASKNNGSYYVVGQESKDANPNAQGAYAQQSETGAFSDSVADGMTINNFYGTTTYYEDEGGSDYSSNDSYASRIRRFNNVDVYSNYGYYDPYYVDPYWNWGWSAYNPYPRSGWSFGWNSWNGWNVGYNMGWNGWGSPYYGYGWGSPYYGYGNGWNSWNNCGWGNNRRWGNNWGYGPYAGGYWNGYDNGYADGYYDGYYGFNDGSWNRGQQYGSTLVGRRQLATDRGFDNPSRIPVSESQTQAKQSKINPSDGRASQPNGSVGIVDQVIKDDSKVKGSFATGQSASAQKLENINGLYTPSKGKTINSTSKQVGINEKSVKASTTYAQNSSPSKYQSEGVRRTPQKANRYAGNVIGTQNATKQVRHYQTQQHQASSSKGEKYSGRTYQSPNQTTKSTRSSQPLKSTRNVSSPQRNSSYTAPSRNTQPSRSYNQPSKQPKSVSPQPSRRSSTSPSSRSKSYSSPSRSRSRSSHSSGSSSRSSKPSLSPSSRSSSSAGRARPSSSGRSGGGSKPSLGRRR